MKMRGGLDLPMDGFVGKYVAIADVEFTFARQILKALAGLLHKAARSAVYTPQCSKVLTAIPTRQQSNLLASFFFGAGIV